MDTVISPARKAHYQQARQRLLDRDLEMRRENQVLQDRAAADARTIIELIVARYQPKRVYQWGSLLRAGAFRPYSDIDIAIEGITDAEVFFALLGEAEKMTGFPLDIIQIEKVVPEYADDIRTKGELVYERK